MEVIIKQDIENLGHKDDIVSVKNGYARNYLIPKGLAVIATKSAKKMHSENLKQRAHKEEKIKAEAIKLGEQIKTKTFKIGAKVSSTGKIFGSVNTIQLAEEINKNGFSIDRKIIKIIDEANIKEIGTYTAILKLHRDVKLEIPFEVFSE